MKPNLPLLSSDSNTNFQTEVQAALAAVNDKNLNHSEELRQKLRSFFDSLIHTGLAHSEPRANSSDLQVVFPKTAPEWALLIDHTLLKADANEKQLNELCSEAKKYSFKTICINSAWLGTAVSQLSNSSVQPITVVGFPLGANLSSAKAFEAREAINLGAKEIDMVLAIGALKSKNYQAVYDDICAVAEVTKQKEILLKVILETCLLSPTEIMIASALTQLAGADFVKTSTGFSTSGATPEAIQLMRLTVGKHFGVKASGGVRSLADAKLMIQCGASRLGTSSGVAILQAFTQSDQTAENPLRKEFTPNGNTPPSQY